jgi:DNA polymerase-4
VPAKRTILHVDMDAFYASVEQRDDPRLRGKPVVVGGGSNRGVVAAASYEVRRYGVRSAMPMREARRRCPDLVRVAPRMSHYKAVSRQLFAVFAEFTPLIEGLSLDEAFLDVTASRGLHGSGAGIARQVKQRILEETSLTASVGIAENKLVAKIASDLDKPDGLVEVMPVDYERVLDPLPVSAIPGIGKQTLARLHKVNVHSIGDLRVAPDRDLEPVFGRYTRRMRDRAAGIDTRPVATGREEKSISAEETYDIDLAERPDMERELLRLAETTAARLRKAGLQAGTVQIKIRLPDFQTFTRQKRLQPPSSSTDQVFHVARKLLRDWLGRNPGARIRLLGVGGSRLSPAGQPDLFAEQESALPEALDKAADDIRRRFGPAAVGRARTLRGRE